MYSKYEKTEILTRLYFRHDTEEYKWVAWQKVHPPLTLMVFQSKKTDKLWGAYFIDYFFSQEFPFGELDLHEVYLLESYTQYRVKGVMEP